MSTEKLPLLERAPSGDSTSPPLSRLRTASRVLFFLSGLLLLRIVLLCSFLAAEQLAAPPLVEDHHAVARHILTEHPLIDGHNDLLITIRALYKNNINNSSFSDLFENGGLPLQVDVPRLEKGQLSGAFWSAFVPCPANGSDFSDANYAPYVRATLDQIDLFHRLSARYPEYFTPSASAADAEAAFQAGRLISPVAIEGLHQIGNSASILRLYHQLGVRYATLTWNCHNAFADAALVNTADGDLSVSKPLWHGVSPRGRLLIHEMNRLGMLVDLSHVSVNTMRDVLVGHADPAAAPSWKGSLAPPIFSHSSAYAICPHPRNVPDDVLQLVRDRNSIVMVNVNPEFISCKPSDQHHGLPEYVDANNTLAQVVRHIIHIGALIGYDHVGIGTDFDGIESTPRGFDGVDKFPDLVAALLEAGVSEADVAKVVGRNLLRVWAEADAVSRDLKAQGWEPLEDEVRNR